jgi:serine/threonine protein phosphatase 1
MIFSKGIDYALATGPDGMRIYAIGDVHGRFDCLMKMHQMIAAEIVRDRPADWRIIHLGDYVDRGPQSREVLEFLSAACARDVRMIATLGNHDEGFLDFLANPDNAHLFIDYGGFDTCASYGVVLRTMKRKELLESHRHMLAAIPEAHLIFLRDLRRSVSFGDFFFCHAGVRPDVALDRQDEHDLIWIRREFLEHRRLYDKVIVHGHTPCRETEIMSNRVNIDTKAFETGRLTALVIDGNEKRFIETRL